VDLLLKLRKTISEVQHKLRMRLYFNNCWLSSTNHFLN